MSRVLSGVDVRTGNDFLGIVSQDKVGKNVTLIFCNVREYTTIGIYLVAYDCW